MLSTTLGLSPGQQTGIRRAFSGPSRMGRGELFQTFSLDPLFHFLLVARNDYTINVSRHYSKSDTLSISYLQSVILRGEATKNPVPGKQATCCVKNETLRFAQDDIGKCDFCLNAN